MGKDWGKRLGKGEGTFERFPPLPQTPILLQDFLILIESLSPDFPCAEGGAACFFLYSGFVPWEMMVLLFEEDVLFLKIVDAIELFFRGLSSFGERGDGFASLKKIRIQKCITWCLYNKNRRGGERGSCLSPSPKGRPSDADGARFRRELRASASWCGASSDVMPAWGAAPAPPEACLFLSLRFPLPRHPAATENTSCADRRTSARCAGCSRRPAGCRA